MDVAAALEVAGFGEAFDPNAVTPDEVRAAAVRLLGLAGDPRARLDRLADDLTANPGARRARAALTGEVTQ